MPLKLNNLEEIYAHYVYLLDPATLDYIEVRDLIGSGGGSRGIVQSVNVPLSISNGVLSLLFFQTQEFQFHDQIKQQKT